MSFLTSQQGRVGGAVVIAITLIIGAYVLSGHGFRPGILNAESSDELLAEYAKKDTDNDGLPDWQEALYGTDPAKAQSAKAGVSDSQAVAQGVVTSPYTTSLDQGARETPVIPGPQAAAGSVTDQFAQLFFSNYLSTRGSVSPTPADIQSFVTSGVATLAANQVKTPAYTAAGVKTGGSGKEALIAYAIGAEAAYAKDGVQLPYDELVYFSDAVNKNDATAIQNVLAISKAYQAVAASISALPAPQEAQGAHLALINAMAQLGLDIGDMASVASDPIRGMLGLGNYHTDAATFSASLRALQVIYKNAGVSIPQGEKGYFFVKLLSKAAATPGAL